MLKIKVGDIVYSKMFEVYFVVRYPNSDIFINPHDYILITDIFSI